MSRYARNRKLVERGHNNRSTVAARNRKADRQFERWLSGLLVEPIELHGRTVWAKVPSGQGIIHNGRKP